MVGTRPDRAAAGARGVGRGAHLGDRADDLHVSTAASSSVRPASDRGPARHRRGTRPARPAGIAARCARTVSDVAARHRTRERGPRAELGDVVDGGPHERQERLERYVGAGLAPGRAARRGGCSRCTRPRGTPTRRVVGHADRRHAHGAGELLDLGSPVDRRRRRRRGVVDPTTGSASDCSGWSAPVRAAIAGERVETPSAGQVHARARVVATASAISVATVSIARSGVAITTRSTPRTTSRASRRRRRSAPPWCARSGASGSRPATPATCQPASTRAPATAPPARPGPIRARRREGSGAGTRSGTDTPAS